MQESDASLGIEQQGVWCGAHAGALFLVSHRGTPAGVGLPLEYSKWEIGVWADCGFFSLLFSLVFENRKGQSKEKEEEK